LFCLATPALKTRRETSPFLTPTKQKIFSICFVWPLWQIGVDYGTQREIILLDNVDKMQRLIKMMQKRQPATKPANDNTDVVLRRIDAETSIELKRIELLMECKITFEQYLQMK